MGASTTFFAVSFDAVARVLNAPEARQEELCSGWLGDQVTKYLAGDRSWTNTAYTIEKTCSLLTTSEQIPTFDPGYDLVGALSSADRLLTELGVEFSFYSHFLDPFPDAPVELPPHEDWPNAAFFSRGTMHGLTRALGAAVRPVPPEFRTFRHRLDSFPEIASKFDSVLPVIALAPGWAWNEFIVDLRTEQNPDGYFEAANIPIDGGTQHEIEQAYDFVERCRDGSDSGVDVRAIELVRGFWTHANVWLANDVDCAVFHH